MVDRFNNRPLSEDSLNILYSANNIDYDLVELFNDFTQSLLLIIFETYLGDDVLTDSDKMKHFDWCWEKNIENFKKEGIIIKDDDEVFNHYLEFMLNFFYLIDKSDDLEEISMTIRVIWTSIFSYKKLKTKKEVDKFLKIYSLMKKTLKKGI